MRMSGEWCLRGDCDAELATLRARAEHFRHAYEKVVEQVKHLEAASARAERLAELLGEVEWGCDHCPRCPICQRPDTSEGHAAACRLAAELARS